MKVVADMDDSTYYENRAIECIYQAHQQPGVELIQQAVGLLLLALVHRNEANKEA
jgi:hypothetical protein